MAATILPYLEPDKVFYMWVQTETQVNVDTDYREFFKEHGHTCDVSRPFELRRCDLDMTEMAAKILTIRPLEYIRTLPRSIQWNAWDWERMQEKPGGYTPVAFAAGLRAYDGSQAYRWNIYCSYIPDQPGKAVCYETYRLGHFNYVIVPAEDVTAVAAYFKGL